MTAFNFGGIENVSAVGSNMSLKPWNIYDVKFDGLTQEDLKGKKDPNAVYKTVKIAFSSDKGGFSKNIFVPSTEDDATRPTYKNKDGHEYSAPSRFENFKFTLLQLVQVLNPAGYKKIQEVSGKIKTMDEFLKVVVNAANAKKGTETSIKLVGRTTEDGKTYAELPRVVSLNKEGELFVSDRFIGPNLSWSVYELSKKEEYEKAKPTDVEKVVNGDASDSTEESTDNSDLNDIDFSSLE